VESESKMFLERLGILQEGLCDLPPVLMMFSKFIVSSSRFSDPERLTTIASITISFSCESFSLALFLLMINSLSCCSVSSILFLYSSHFSFNFFTVNFSCSPMERGGERREEEGGEEEGEGTTNGSTCEVVTYPYLFLPLFSTKYFIIFFTLFLLCEVNLFFKFHCFKNSGLCSKW